MLQTFITETIQTFNKYNPNVTSCHAGSEYVAYSFEQGTPYQNRFDRLKSEDFLPKDVYIYDQEKLTREEFCEVWDQRGEHWIGIGIDCGKLVHDFTLYKDEKEDMWIIDSYGGSDVYRSLSARPFDLSDLFEFIESKDVNIWDKMFMCKESKTRSEEDCSGIFTISLGGSVCKDRKLYLDGKIVS